MKRYDICMVEDRDGLYVEFTEYDALRARVEELESTPIKCIWCGLRIATVDEAASHVLVCDKGPWVALAKRAAELEALLHEIAEEWAGSECGEPMTAQEAYAVRVAKRMYAIAVRALVPNTTRETQ